MVVAQRNNEVHLIPYSVECTTAELDSRLHLGAARAAASSAGYEYPVAFDPNDSAWMYLSDHVRWSHVAQVDVQGRITRQEVYDFGLPEIATLMAELRNQVTQHRCYEILPTEESRRPLIRELEEVMARRRTASSESPLGSFAWVLQRLLAGGVVMSDSQIAHCVRYCLLGEEN